MDVYELTTCSFIVKIWIEEFSDQMGKPLWRGHITHLPGGERKYFEDLGQMFDFMLPYLQAMGINPDMRSATGGS